MLRFITYALPVLILLLALFGFTVELLDAEPRQGSVIRLALFDTPLIPAPVVLGAWLMEACGLLALFLLARGRCGTWWLDGLVTGWIAWVFRGPLLVITLVVAARQPQHPWWTLVFGWWVLYSICGLFLAHLARSSNLEDDDVEEVDQEELEENDRGSNDLDAPEALSEEPVSTLEESSTPKNETSAPLPVKENPPLEEPKAAVEPYPSPEEDSSLDHSDEGSNEDRDESSGRGEDSAAANSETADVVSPESPPEKPPKEPASTPARDTADQPKQDESGPKPAAEET